MFPRTELGERKYRKYIRELEMPLIVETISNFLKNNSKIKNINILEFGCGNGYQIPFLQRIGNIVASDIVISDNIKDMKGINFVECDITDAPFHSGQFDVIFSSHVIEHIENTYSALDGLKRIGKPDCIYAFSLPTNIKLLLSIPAQYYINIKGAIRTLLSLFFNNKMSKSGLDNNTDSKQKRRTIKSIISALFFILLPRGHGVHLGFIDCYNFFRIKSWQRLFSNNGFLVLKTQPLLLCGMPEWPIIPVTRFFNRLNICSNVLFIVKKHGHKY